MSSITSTPAPNGTPSTSDQATRDVSAFPLISRLFYGSKDPQLRPHLLIRDPSSVESKLRKIVDDGKDKIHVISDFDMTLTKFWVPVGSGNSQDETTLRGDGLERNVSSHGVVMRSGRFPKEFKDRTDALYRLYYPIETSHTMTRADKVPHMVEWWTKAHELIVQLQCTKEDVVEMVKQTPVRFREGGREVLGNCREKGVPVLVFSAGVADVIEEILRQNSLYLSNVNVVANHMEWNENDVCVAFRDPLVHVFSKSELSVPSSVTLNARPNVLLLGDSLGDLEMSSGVPHDVCLTVGFLNHQRNKLEDEYARKFDVVVTDDVGFDEAGVLGVIDGLR
ncbi:UMPH-1-domain-containing protein [Gonapodya prolifera JEL478]|uniref:5'-nucleotidase n=1 Tax=Gonapodya prolifera (strain JEL478) TaxID=1344416 RepID=A0A139AFU3_GONPJ|nr:UMPH-1-domain-containing protein [Gonapodya prolifera JEL478]|eukprot:KXS15434.1 UMPH-1-domain-containing protein [Gonapodya prolifera JEL478]